MDPLTVLAALGPLVVDLGKGLIGKVLGQSDYKPVNIDEWARMRGIELDTFRAINQAGAEGESYPWVHAVIKLQRPIVVGVTLGVWAWSRTWGTPSNDIDNAAGVVCFYLFGDRTLIAAKKQAQGAR